MGNNLIEEVFNMYLYEVNENGLDITELDLDVLLSVIVLY